MYTWILAVLTLHPPLLFPLLSQLNLPSFGQTPGSTHTEAGMMHKAWRTNHIQAKWLANLLLSRATFPQLGVSPLCTSCPLSYSCPQSYSRVTWYTVFTLSGAQVSLCPYVSSPQKHPLASRPSGSNHWEKMVWRLCIHPFTHPDAMQLLGPHSSSETGLYLIFLTWLRQGQKWQTPKNLRALSFPLLPSVTEKKIAGGLACCCFFSSPSILRSKWAYKELIIGGGQRIEK